MKNEFAVEMKGITKIFNGVKANDHIDFSVKQGSVHGLLGENGAGKTTLMNVLYGLYKPEEGSIFVNDKKEIIASPNDAIRIGIGMVHQHFMLARPLTVVENVMLGRKSRRGILLDTKETAEELQVLSAQYNMNIDPFSKIWQLSVGEQQRVEILTALYRGAQILILDEPTAVLTPQEVNVFFETLRRMKRDGKSIILITHKLDEILDVSDEVTVLRDGRRIGSSVLDGSVTKQDLTRMMVGRDVFYSFPNFEKEPGPVRLSCKHLRANNDKGIPALKDLSFEVHQGEIVGVAGVDGNGQNELCEVLTGLRKLTDGTITLEGVDMTNKSPSVCIDHQISYIPEDRHATGLAMNWPLRRNLILKSIGKKPFSRHGIMRKRIIVQYWEQTQKEYQIKAINGEQLAKDLSGGNQQKIILARDIKLHPDLIIAHQPTRGLDIGASEYVRSKLIEARNNGTSVLIVSADLEELIQLSDRIMVLYNGQIMGILPRGADMFAIGALMMGERQEAEHGEA